MAMATCIAPLQMVHLCLLLLSLGVSFSVSAADSPPPPPPRGFFISCGSSKAETIRGINWITDEGFTKVGNISNIHTTGILPILSSLRYFPDKSATKYCFVIPVAKGEKYLVRTTYYYGGFDGGTEPPVFDQIIGGTKWSTVNTTENYANGLTTYYEVILVSHGKTISVCLARNEYTTSNPFISALELVYLEDSMYNSTDYKKYALATIAHQNFGPDAQTLSYPHDPYNRYWESYSLNTTIFSSHSKVTSSNFWNFPPEILFGAGLAAGAGSNLTLQWPASSLARTSYYLALYFQAPEPINSRVLDVAVNGEEFYAGLNVSSNGVMVYGTLQLSGHTEITVTPKRSSDCALINAAELLQIVALNGRTRTSDVIAMESMARTFANPPADWSGDPCLPTGRSWTGVTCSQGKFARVIALDLTNFGISGLLPENIRRLTAIQKIWLGGNKLFGTIPDSIGSLKQLVSLHLENNQLTGPIPSSLGNLTKLEELYLQQNKFHGQLPESLKQRRIKIQV